MKRPLVPLLSLLFVLVLAFSSVAQAAEQQNLPMQQLDLSIWPEYDRPQVLVIYNGVLQNNTGKPFQGEIRYNLPQGAEVNMVCELEKGMLCQPYNIVQTEGGQQVVWRPSRAIQPGETFPVMFEYYYNPVSGAGKRDLEIDLAPGFAVGQLRVTVQEPLRASEFKLDPPPQSTGKEEVQGQTFTTYYYSYSNFPADGKLRFRLSYNKADANPSVSNAAKQASTSAQEGKGLNFSTSFNPTIIVLLAAFVAVLLVFLFVALRQQPAPAAAGGNHRARRQKTKTAAPRLSPTQQEERRKLRRMLLEGKISEETYLQLLEEIEREK